MRSNRVCVCIPVRICLYEHGIGTHLRVLSEEVVGVEVDSAKVPDGVELEGDFNGALPSAVVLPPHPLVS